MSMRAALANLRVEEIAIVTSDAQAPNAERNGVLHSLRQGTYGRAGLGAKPVSRRVRHRDGNSWLLHGCRAPHESFVIATSTRATRSAEREREPHPIPSSDGFAMGRLVSWWREGWWRVDAPIRHD